MVIFFTSDLFHIIHQLIIFLSLQTFLKINHLLPFVWELGQIKKQ